MWIFCRCHKIWNILQFMRKQILHHENQKWNWKHEIIWLNCFQLQTGQGDFFQLQFEHSSFIYQYEKTVIMTIYFHAFQSFILSDCYVWKSFDDVFAKIYVFIIHVFLNGNTHQNIYSEFWKFSVTKDSRSQERLDAWKNNAPFWWNCLTFIFFLSGNLSSQSDMLFSRRCLTDADGTNDDFSNKNLFFMLIWKWQKKKLVKTKKKC